MYVEYVSKSANMVDDRVPEQASKRSDPKPDRHRENPVPAMLHTKLGPA